MKICIENKDRHGLVYDISKILLKYNVNIISMEVIKNTTYLETEALSYKGEQKILSELHKLSGIVQIKSIMLMPHNEKYQQMDIVFNTINEGIIITDKNGDIIYINKIAVKNRKHSILKNRPKTCLFILTFNKLANNKIKLITNPTKQVLAINIPTTRTNKYNIPKSNCFFFEKDCKSNDIIKIRPNPNISPPPK